MSRRVAIVGGAGFVGTNLATAALDRGHDIVVYDVGDRLGRLGAADPAGRVERRFVDLSAPGAEVDGDADIIVHLAALAHVDHSLYEPGRVVANNTAVMTAVLSAARRHGLPVVFASSIEVYGGNDGAIFDEDAPPAPLSPYAASKVGCEALAASYTAAYGVPVTTVRLTNLYGPWQAPDRVLPRVTAQALLDHPVQAVRGRVRDFLHVDDGVAALMTLLEADDHGGVYNIAAGDGIDVADAVETVLTALGRGRMEVVDAPAGDGRGDSLVASADRLVLRTGWKPLVPVEEGVERTVAWYRDARRWWEPFEDAIRAPRDTPAFLLDHAFPF